MRTLFKHVNILDCTGAPPFRGRVLVDGETIAGVWPEDERPDTVDADVSDAEVFEGRGATLMPGLIEPHSHLTFTNYTRSVEMGAIPPEEHMLITVRNARRMLEMGFTSCFSAASAKPRLDVVLRNAIDAGRVSRATHLGRVTGADRNGWSRRCTAFPLLSGKFCSGARRSDRIPALCAADVPRRRRHLEN